MFKIKKNIYTLVLSSLFMLLAGFSTICYAVPAAAPAQKTEIVQNTACNTLNATAVNPLDIVKDPEKYLNKEIVMNAAFDKFSVLGLDYKKALRPSADYITFLVQREDVIDHNIPLSEMKLFVKREYAEKFTDLDTGDKIEIIGKVFSTALGDAWVDVDKITVLKKAKAEEAKK